MSFERFPSLGSKKSHKVSGIGGQQYAGDPVNCDILISSSWATQQAVKLLSIPDI